MYSEYTVDDVIEASSNFVQNSSNVSLEVIQRLNNIDTVFSKMVDQYCNEELLLTTGKLTNIEYNKQQEFTENVKQNKVNIKNMESTVSKLDSLKSKKEEECSSLESNVNTLKEKLGSVLEEKENLKRKKCEILAYKVLSHIDFVYSKKNILGIINKEEPESFNFNPKELSPEEITENLWEMIMRK